VTFRQRRDLRFFRLCRNILRRDRRFLRLICRIRAVLLVRSVRIVRFLCRLPAHLPLRIADQSVHAFFHILLRVGIEPGRGAAFSVTADIFASAVRRGSHLAQKITQRFPQGFFLPRGRLFDGKIPLDRFLWRRGTRLLLALRQRG